jgi:glycosyltransferase involved in cell wall biosynthesis
VTRRLSILYAAPGQHLVESAGPSRNVLSVADALADSADVTIAFRTVPPGFESRRFRVLGIEGAKQVGSAAVDDNAARGIRPVSHLAYCLALGRFARMQAAAFDVVLEKGWRLSGVLANGFQRAGVPGVIVENDVRLWTEPVNGPRQLVKFILHHAAEFVARRCSRRVSAVIAETDGLKELLVSRRGLAPDRVHVVGLGVDQNRFRPQAQHDVRRALGLSESALVLLYVGALDEYHDLEPVIDALSGIGRRNMELHVVGGGTLRDQCEARARRDGVAARFHGPVPHDNVPRFIAAADLCLSPYRTSAFHGSVVTFSTLKVPEYMACARPVATVTGTAAGTLIEDRTSGFVVANTSEAWKALFERLPSRDRLAEMGLAAKAAVAPVSWQRTASGYLDVCASVVAEARRMRTDIASPAAATR